MSSQTGRVFQGMLLFFVLACDTFILYRVRLVRDAARPGREARRMSMAEAIILTIIIASTPLLLAALGELVAERSGVLNLGVEGMMIMGAVCGFVATVRDRRAALRHPRGDRSPAWLTGVAVRLRDAGAGRQPGGDAAWR